MNFVETTNGRICKSFKDDCVVRSISIAMDKPYTDVFDDLMQLGLLLGAYPNHDKVWHKYLKDNNWIKNKPPRNTNGKMIKLLNWIDSPDRAVVINSGHLTCVKDGAIHDTWDCRYRPVNSYWTLAS